MIIEFVKVIWMNTVLIMNVNSGIEYTNLNTIMIIIIVIYYL